MASSCCGSPWWDHLGHRLQRRLFLLGQGLLDHWDVGLRQALRALAFPFWPKEGGLRMVSCRAGVVWFPC